MQFKMTGSQPSVINENYSYEKKAQDLKHNSGTWQARQGQAE